jgi:hypothetical protein
MATTIQAGHTRHHPTRANTAVLRNCELGQDFSFSTLGPLAFMPDVLLYCFTFYLVRHMD